MIRIKLQNGKEICSNDQYAEGACALIIYAKDKIYGYPWSNIAYYEIDRDND